jgi:hypothetical protein
LADGIFGVDDAIMGGIECYWWKFWRRLRALTEQLPRPVALAGAFEVPTGGTALSEDVGMALRTTAVQLTPKIPSVLLTIFCSF